MGAFFGAVSHRDVALDVFFGVDYHSHLGTRRAGMASCREGGGFSRQIHSIENTPFRTKFEHDLPGLSGTCVMGCISDSDPQPLLVRSHLGLYAISTVGAIANQDELVERFEKAGHQFGAMGSGAVNVNELVAALINSQGSIVEGIRYAQDEIEGSLTLLIMTDDGTLITARDKMGRLPVLIGKDDDGYCVSFESFAYGKLGYVDEYELGSAEIVRLTAEGYETLSPARDEMRICAFLWVYYGYPNSNYEGVNVECMRYRNGQIMARDERAAGLLPEIDYVAGMPDSGLPHGIGYANESGVPLARPFVKYTPTWPRSFMPANQEVRNRVAKMKQIPVPELIRDKRLLLVDDSIVRGTQMRETIDFLRDTGSSRSPAAAPSTSSLRAARSASLRATRARSISTSTLTVAPSAAAACCAPSARRWALTPWSSRAWTACSRPLASTARRSAPTAGAAATSLSKGDRHQTADITCQKE